MSCGSGVASSDGFGDEFSFALDADALQQIDQAVAAKQAQAEPARPPPPPAKSAEADFSDDDFPELTAEELREIDNMSAQPTAQLAHRPPGPTSAATSTSTPSSRRSPPPQINAVAGPSSVRAQPQPQPQRNMHVGVSRHGASPTANGRARQANLLGGFADEGEADRRSSALAQHLVTKVGKKWDRTAFAATGKRIVPQKKPGAQANEDEEAEEPEEDEPDDDGGTAGFEQFPQGSEYMVNPRAPLPPFKHKLDEEASETWVYPTNLPIRNYQRSIVANCLFQNTLVALPTGLGKTFIAGVMMLNYSRWFPTGKIFFIAPTKTVVDQQARAFPETCGFLKSGVATLMGDTPAARRAAEYPKRSVFFMTPQSLANDIKKGAIDPLDITLLVIDEAHKATGSAAYCQVVSLIQARNHNFRILALTATPAGKSEGIQNVIDNLHLSHIEIRDDASIDIQQYVHDKTVEQIHVPCSPEVAKLRDILAGLMRPGMQKLLAAGVLHDGNMDPARLQPFTCLNAKSTRQGGKFFGVLNALERYSRAMVYLIEQSIIYSATALSTAKDDKFQSKNKQIDEYLKYVQQLRGQPEHAAHPKMVLTKKLLIDHFTGNGGDESVDISNTRVIVFLSFRDSLMELVNFLNEDSPLIRAHQFVGQSKTKSGAGISRKEQGPILDDFKSGKYNVLVATQVAEEGLDIGAVDKIINYDVPSSSTRTIQRGGRTGRKRDGTVLCLTAEGREETAYAKAQNSYQSVIDAITRGGDLELYDDVPRLLPPKHQPRIDERDCPIDTSPIEAPEKAGRKEKKPRVSAVKGTKAERGTPVPKGAMDGFVSASKLKVAANKPVPAELEDDSDDAAIEAGPSLLRFNSEPTSNDKGKGKGKAKLSAKGKGKANARPAGDDSDDQSARPIKRAKTMPTTSTKKRPSEVIDLDDDDDNNDASSSKPVKLPLGRAKPGKAAAARARARSSSPAGPPLRAAKAGQASPRKPSNSRPSNSLFEWPSSPPESDGPPSPRPPPPAKQIVPIAQAPAAKQCIVPQPPPPATIKARLPPANAIGSASRAQPPARSMSATGMPTSAFPPQPAGIASAEPEAGPSKHRTAAEVAAMAGFSDIDMSWVLADDDEDWNATPPVPRSQPEPEQPRPPPSITSSAMAPPAFPHRPQHPAQSSPSIDGSPFPATQHPIRRAGARKKLKATVYSSSPVTTEVKRHAACSSSPPRHRSGESSTSVLKRPFRPMQPRFNPPFASTPDPVTNPARKKKRGPAPRDVTRYMGLDAEDDRSSEGTMSDDGSAAGDVYSESDLAFAGDFQATQAPKGYDQGAVYRAGLQSQGGPAFKGRKGRASEVIDEMFRKRGRRDSESPVKIGQGDWGSDEDSYGTGDDFVVADDEPIEYDPSSEA